MCVRGGVVEKKLNRDHDFLVWAWSASLPPLGSLGSNRFWIFAVATPT